MAPYCELPALLPMEVNFKKIWMYIFLLYHIRRKLRESLLCMFQGCAKVFFRSYPTTPQNKIKGVVPVLRRAQNRHKTLYLSKEGLGTSKKGLFVSPDVQLWLTTPLPPSPPG